MKPTNICRTAAHNNNQHLPGFICCSPAAGCNDAVQCYSVSCRPGHVHLFGTSTSIKRCSNQASSGYGSIACKRHITLQAAPQPPPSPPPPPPPPSRDVFSTWDKLKERIRPLYLPLSFVGGTLTFGLRTASENFVFSEDPFGYVACTLVSGALVMALAWVLFDFLDDAPAPGQRR